jgi:hypothetical protein
MADPHIEIIRKRVCPEHLCRIFANLRILDRVKCHELELRVLSLTLKTKPFWDYRGKFCTHNEQSLVLDHFYPDFDPRHVVAKTHRHITVTGEAGASGLYDPKSITTAEGVKYQPLPSLTSRCELCESGDMIPENLRFRDSFYKPST